LILTPPTTQFEVPPPSEKIAGGFQQAGKKEGGWGEGIFARLLSAEGGMEWESVSAIPASAGRKNRKIFVSLIEKNFGGARLKKCKENFSVLLAVRRAETLGGIYSKSASGFSLKKVRILFRTDSQFVKFAFPASLGASPLASANEFSSNFQTSQSFFARRENAKRQFSAQKRL